MKKGFTLIELLIVIAIIAIIAGAVLVAVNPAKRIADANDGRRWTEVNSILSAIGQYIVDNTGNDRICAGAATNDYCTQMDVTESGGYCQATTTTDLVNTISSFVDCSPGTTCAAGVNDNCDLSILVEGGLLAQIPTDPSLADTSTSTGYRIYRTTTGAICVEAAWPSGYYTGSAIKACR